MTGRQQKKEVLKDSHLKTKTNRARHLPHDEGSLRRSAWLCSLESFSVVSSEGKASTEASRGRGKERGAREDIPYEHGRVLVV